MLQVRELQEMYGFKAEAGKGKTMKKCQDNEGGDQGIFRYVQFNMLVSLSVLLHRCQSFFLRPGITPSLSLSGPVFSFLPSPVRIARSEGEAESL